MTALDLAGLSWLYAGRPDGAFYVLMLSLSAIGGGWGMLGLLPWLAWSRSRRFASALVATLVVTSLVVWGLKALIGRARPCVSVPGLVALCAAPTDPSFPSGHAAGSFAFAAFVSTWALGSHLQTATRWAVVAAAMSFASGVAASRVALGVHFPSDVLAGAILGAAFGWAGARAVSRRGATPPTVTSSSRRGPTKSSSI